MKTTGKFTAGTNPGTARCTVCGQVRQKGNMERTGPREAICTPCYDRAGDENSVSDGYLTCAEFQARYAGEHSEYCDCK